ncbi:MAG: DUF5305 domain-containing protein [Clostridiaceae bacterium]|nr:DUF5305 domain-containing protein [Clostridiaceae bacterium]
MRLKIAKTLKIILIVVNIILIIGAFIYLYLYYTIPHLMEEKIPKYEYAQKGEANYRVFLKPNDLYDEESMDEGKIYITQIVDYIKVNFAYNFQGNMPADIKGDYEIVAVMEGYTVQNEVERTIWKKVFPVVEKTNIKAHKESILIDGEALIKLEEYAEYAKNLMETLKISSINKLCVQMNVNLTAKADNGGISVQGKMSPTIEIPLNINYFMIGKSGREEKPGKVEESRQVQIPADKRIIILNGAIILVLILTLLYLIIFTKAPTREDIYIKKFRRMFKSHGNRLAALDDKFNAPDKHFCSVRTIDDLVKIADELGKPVLYEYNPNYMQIIKFYVIDDPWIYMLNVREYIYGLIDKDTIY